MSILKKLFGQYFMRKRSSEDDIRAFIAREVAAAFSSRDEICQTVTEVFDDDADSAVLASVPRLVDEALENHRIAQLSWPIITDCDRLDSAFNALEAEGIIARQNFSCCGSCGVLEIADEMRAADAYGAAVKGYTFFHVQDTENAVEGGGVYLNYGGVDGPEAEDLLVGERICAVAKRSGLCVDWDGLLRNRIRIDVDWKRRRTD